MTNIHGVPPPIAPRPAEPTGPITPSEAKTEPPELTDVVEISDVARFAASVQEIPEVRTELVQQVRQQIAAGTYETPDRLDIAVERLMDELFPEL